MKVRNMAYYIVAVSKMKNAMYWFFLLVLIVGGVNTALYNLFGVSLFAPFKGMVVKGIAVTKIIYATIGIAAIIVFISNFSLTFRPKKKE